MRICIRRTGAFGDVVMATPIVRRMRQLYPDTVITVQTDYPCVFEHDRDVDIDSRSPNRVVNLDLAYERRPKMHAVEAYMMEAFDDSGTPAERAISIATTSPAGWLAWPDRPVIVVHAGGVGWRSRVRSRDFWDEIAKRLYDHGFCVASVGTPRDYFVGEIDLRGNGPTERISLSDLIAILNGAACFVGMDSGPLHVAGTTQVPIVGLFTSALPQYRLPWRNGVLGDRCVALTPDLDCVGCLHDLPPPVTACGCRRGDYACAEGSQAVTPERVIEAALGLIY